MTVSEKKSEYSNWQRHQKRWPNSRFGQSVQAATGRIKRRSYVFPSDSPSVATTRPCPRRHDFDDLAAIMSIVTAFPFRADSRRCTDEIRSNWIACRSAQSILPANLINLASVRVLTLDERKVMVGLDRMTACLCVAGISSWIAAASRRTNVC